MLTDCRLPLLAVMLCLLDSGCISVRYGDCRLPLEPTPAVRPFPCGDGIEPAPPRHEVPPLREAPLEDEPPVVRVAPPTVETGLAPEPACLVAKSWHSRIHAALPSFWRFRRQVEPPAVAPLIPPRSRFHPVPTRPVFARQVIYESVPPLVTPELGDPLPEPIDTPPSVEAPLDAEAGEAPRPLSDALRVASPIAPRVPTQTR